MSTSLIDVQNLTKKFGGVTALDKVSLSIPSSPTSKLIWLLVSGVRLGGNFVM